MTVEGYHRGGEVEVDCFYGEDFPYGGVDAVRVYFRLFDADYFVTWGEDSAVGIQGFWFWYGFYFDGEVEGYVVVDIAGSADHFMYGVGLVVGELVAIPATTVVAFSFKFGHGILLLFYDLDETVGGGTHIQSASGIVV